MQSTAPLLILFAILVWGTTQKRHASLPLSAEPANPLQQLCTLLAFVAGLLIILNPEFLALGLLTDASFFDLLIVLLSVQLQFNAARAWDFLSAILSRVMRLISARLHLTFSVLALTLEQVGHAFCAMYKALRQGRQPLGLTP